MTEERERDRRWRAGEGEKQLQTFVLEQMDSKKERARAELEESRDGKSTMGRFLEAILDNAEVDPYAPEPEPPAPDPSLTPEEHARELALAYARTKGITGAPQRAKADRPLDPPSLLASLKKQMHDKASLKSTEKRHALSEEKRYLDHITDEMDLYATRRRASALEQQRDLLDAWEKGVHLRQMEKLAVAGPAAIRKYAAEHVLSARGRVRGARDQDGAGEEWPTISQSLSKLES